MPNAAQLQTRDAWAYPVRKLAVVLTVGVYAVIAPFGWAGFAVLCALWRADPNRRARRLQRVTVVAYRLMHDWLRVLRIADFDHRRGLAGMPEGPCVVVANHPTLMDITAITATLGGGCTIVKPAVYRRWLMHRLLVGAGHVEGPGTDVVAIQRVVQAAVERLRSGFSVIVFPEGTRSPAGGLHGFARTPFEIACQARVPVVSLTVRCDPVYLSKDVPLFRPPRATPRLRLALLAVDPPASFEDGSRGLRDRVAARYVDWQRGASTAA